MKEIKHWMFAAGFLVCSLMAGCGGAQNVETIDNQCLEKCKLSYMTCLDESRCMGPGGTTVPCETECNNKQSDCLSAC